MTIRELRILPPFAIGRLGSAPAPLDNFTMVESQEHPLDYRALVPQETLTVNERTGEISGSHTPDAIAFKDDAGRIRPVAPFLEVFARVDRSRAWQPLTLSLLSKHGYKVADLSWHVTVANRKVERRTTDENDRVEAHTGWFSSHAPRRLKGHCANFIDDDSAIDFGSVQFIKPTRKYPEIRFRFSPAKGLIYGPNLSAKAWKELEAAHPEMYQVPKAQRIYDQKKGRWYEFEVPAAIEDALPDDTGKFVSETMPPALFSIIPPAPTWLNDNIAISRGYFDDACDGIVEVALTAKKKGGERLTAAARITSSPPALVPDSLFVRTLVDDLDQVIFGPEIDASETPDEIRRQAEDILRRAFETVRYLNVAVMNGNPVNSRNPLDIDTMPAEEAFDVLRPMRPVFSEKTADTLAIMRLHMQVFATLRAGAAPWFPGLLRKPDEVGDFTDHGRRKMPALMCGADGNYLALTHRQINTIARAATQPLDMTDETGPDVEADPPALKARNLSAQRHKDVNHVARGNPVSSRPVTSVGNCTPGLEVDFRAVWRRVFEGIELREWDNLVVHVDDPALQHLKGCRLLRVTHDRRQFFTMTTMIGPSPADTTGQSVVYATDANPNGLAPLEWSNALAHMLHGSVGTKVTCDFTKAPSWFVQQPWNDDPASYVTHELMVREFFEDETSVISRVLAEAGELTQGLCSPWQNDYRECSCYYWASARPDFVNVDITSAGASTGDNWLQKVRTGDYVPDDYVDSRLVLYEDLFARWEHWLRFAIRGQDAPGETRG